MRVEVRPEIATGSVLDLLPTLVTRTAHDLNNHLARILGKAELALMMADETRYRASLEEVCDAGQDARALVADLQRVISWFNTEQGSLPVADILTVVGRISGRHCRHNGVTLQIEPASGTVPSRSGAALGLMLWQLIEYALDGASADDLAGEAWTLAGSRADGVGVMLETSRPLWDVETRAAISRALRTGEPMDGAPGQLIAGLRAIDGSLVFEGPAIVLLGPS